MNRPFLCPKQDVRERIFSQINQLSRSVFCFFSSRKEIVPLLFFLEEKPVGMRGKRNPSDGRTQAHPALSSVGIPQRVCLPPPPCLCPCPPRLRATQNGCLLFFLEEKTVSMRGKRSPSDGRTQAHPALSSVGIPQRVCLPPPPCLCPCPPRLRASFPVQADHAKENHQRNSCLSALLPFSPTRCTKRTVHIRTVFFSF